eukprot:gnl/TRDRNA2_/TRDRNA2_141112_c0_seq1.p1 gnl/TRDRNA2_/TRDRNA2_141112_c0~~gnl/TRDRNA2_/TRDRNA2_141112_c0_seq1.p1  ORF type:complete len:149 (+),score=31.25 gnl/TRDRNA2_/TRDRNA2_141112_c0_seq1:1-447(+)
MIGFAVMRVITAVFVQEVVQGAAQDAELALKNQQKTTVKFLKSMKEAFRELDDNGDGTLTYSEFQDILDNPTVSLLLTNVDVHLDDLCELWTLLDTGDGKVDSDEFVEGIRRIHGVAQGMDMVRLLRLVESLVAKIDRAYPPQRQRMS